MTQVQKLQIKITCDCGMIHEVERTSEIPDNVISMGCNWCPVCMDSADAPYEEWYNEDDGENGEPKPIPIGDNQLVMPFDIEDCINLPETEYIVKE